MHNSKDRVLIGSYLHALTWSTLQVIVGEEVSLQGVHTSVIDDADTKKGIIPI